MVVMMDLDQNLFPSTASFVVLLCHSIYNVGVVINDYHDHLRGEVGRVFIKEFHDSHVGRACNG